MEAHDNLGFRNQSARTRCIPDKSSQKKLLREFKRILRRGGLLLISDYLRTMNGNAVRSLQPWARST